MTTTPNPEDTPATEHDIQAAEHAGAGNPAATPPTPAPRPPADVLAQRAPAETTPASPPGTLAEAAATDAANDLTRADTTNTALLGMAGVLLTVLVAGAGLTADAHVPAAARIAMGAAATVLAGVLLVLTSATWPRHGGTGGVPYYANRTAEQLAAELASADPARWHAECAVVKSCIAVRKHHSQRLAAAGLAAVGLLLAAATVITLVA